MSKARESKTAMLARQPILNSQRRIFGYELLYRGPQISQADRGSVATARVMCEALGNLSIEQVVGEGHVFINFDAAMLSEGAASLLPPGRSVVEILESVEATPELLALVEGLKRSGVKIALDDFVFQLHARPFLTYADYIKVDVLACAEQLPEITARLRQVTNACLIAEKVETPEQHMLCSELGYTLFQGYYFARPESVVRERIGSNRLAILQVLRELQSADRSADQLAHAIGRDVRLAQQILRLSNSTAYGRTRKVRSIAEATVVLGEDTVRRCASLLLLAQIAENKPPALISLALTRGQMCEQSARAVQGADAGSAFTLGLFSVLDALLDRPMQAIVTELDLPQEMSAALLGQTNLPLGALLQGVLAYEKGDWSRTEDLGADWTDLSRSYLQALRVADSLVA